MSMSRKRLALLVAGGVVVVGATAWAVAGSLGGGEDTDAESWAEVRRGPLVISIAESGTIKNREQVVIKSEVEGRTAILTLVEEGTWVKPGDLLVELDASQLMDQKAAQQITVINAEAAHVRARENLEVTRSQADSDTARADQDLRFAKLDFEKYEQGEYPQLVQQAEADITIAREEVERAKEKLEWSKRLNEQRYLSRVELQADQLALQKAELDLELAEGRKKLLEGYTHRRNLEALQTDIELAESALERTRRKGAADVVQAEAELRAKEQELARQKSKLEKLEDQIAKCHIVAPRAGMVVYATTGRGGWRSDEQPLAEGQEVRERQEIIYLPTATSMMAEVKIHESSLEKVKVGMPVRVTVDAVPARSWDGHVDRIAVLPDATSVWLNPDLKLYNSEIVLDGDGSDLRTGMSCRAEIFVDRYDDALSVPVQCVVRVAGKPTVYVKGPQGPVARAIRIGLDNNRFVHVLEGLTAGEPVLLAPPLSEAVPAAAAPPPATAKPAAPAAPAATPEGGTDGANRGLSREERRKQFEQLSPEERQKRMEEFRRRRNEGAGDK